ncbi:hypothetical protein [Candidatus Nasuia deltocephalinicola]|uniref:hypothetical protein n=1 Tax=Candidatus Nasuia deltocephalincola TaxID=1160784 RepID=UPI00216ACA2E|nr:hypothetical protein [Candidatus Nasuia deltocephalinicola]
MKYEKIINLEKKKIELKIKFKKTRNIKIKIIKDGCFGKKYIYFYTKKIKNKNIIINYKKKKIIIEFKTYIIIKKSIIKINKNIKIKNKNYKNICKCKFSFNYI